VNLRESVLSNFPTFQFSERNKPIVVNIFSSKQTPNNAITGHRNISNVVESIFISFSNLTKSNLKIISFLKEQQLLLKLLFFSEDLIANISSKPRSSEKPCLPVLITHLATKWITDALVV